MAPLAFPQPPSLPEALAVVNSNNTRVRQLHTDSASLSTPGLPAIRAEISLEKPQNFRLEGRMFGPEVDIGSNPELFWVWLKSDPQQAIYFAHHEQFEGSRIQNAMPIEPHWLVDAFGLVELDPRDLHEGPYAVGQDRYEIRSAVRRGHEVLQRSLIMHASYGWVLEQTIYDARGQVVADMKASRHRFYPEHEVSLPHRIQIEVPKAELSFQIDISEYVVNQLLPEPSRWQMPQLNGYKLINLAGDVQQPSRVRLTPMPVYDAPRTSYSPSVRGYSFTRQIR